MRVGAFLSHVLASLLGGLILAGVLLALGVIGKQRTETVPIPSSEIPPTQAGGGAPAASVLAQIYDQDSPGVVVVRATIGRRVASPFGTGRVAVGTTLTSSGFLISRQGFILTTFHTVEGADAARGIQVVFNATTTRAATMVSEDAPDDLALLKVSMTGVPAVVGPLPLGNSRSVSVGESAIALANPYGLSRTLAGGVVSALQRRLIGLDGTAIDDVIETDISPSPGGDGGPLLDLNGNVIGINSELRVSSGASTYPVAFAVPIDAARSIIPKGVLP